jgi:CDP-diglyceride synthetase
MELNLRFVIIQISDTQLLALFWVLTVAVSFNVAYFLFLKDRGSEAVSARNIMTFIIGTLVVVGTYADTLAQKPFVLKDCLLLALVAAHGWTAEDMVQSFIKKATGKRPAP